jgi:F-type H+-transporting ATPase subunit delta
MESVIAEKYAAALLEAAKEQGVVEAVARELKAVRALVGETGELKSLLEHPRLNPAEKVKALQALLAGASMSPLMERFLLLLMSKKRMRYLAAVADQFERLQYQAAGRTVVRVLTAMPLEAAQRDTLARRVSEMFRMEAEIREEVQPDLVGGMVLYAGDQRLDASVLGQLGRMKQAILQETL